MSTGETIASYIVAAFALIGYAAFIVWLAHEIGKFLGLNRLDEDEDDE